MSEYIEHDRDNISVGIVEKKFFTFADPPNEMVLESGARLGPITLAYETCGSLKVDRSNVVLIPHALSGDSHVAGYYNPEDENPGWWDNMVDPGKGIDTDKFYVVCTNIIGSCMGSTGPGAINPKTGLTHALDFPVVTIGDMVQAQKALMDHHGTTPPTSGSLPSRISENLPTRSVSPSSRKPPSIRNPNLFATYGIFLIGRGR